MTLSPQLLHAIKKVGADAEKVRDSLADAKTYKIDAGVHFAGQLVVNPTSQISVSTKPPADLVLAALLSQFGPRKRVEIVEQIIESGLEKAIVDAEQTKQLAEQLLSDLTTRTVTTRRGAVTGIITAELITQ